MYREGVTLKEFLEGFRYQAGLVVQWIMMGSSGREHRPEHGGVLRHYQHCDKKVNIFMKTIANTWFLANHCENVHNVEYRCAHANSSINWCCPTFTPTHL